MTTTTATKLRDGLPTVYARAVPLGQCAALADPVLLEQHRALVAWPAVSAEWHELSFGERFGREPPALPLYNGRSVGSPQMVPQATLDAAGDLDRDVRARLADGHLRVLAFQEPRQLDAEPVLLPADLVATATAVTWRTGTLEAGGMMFIECRVVPAADLAEPEAEAQPVTVPPATLPALVAALVELFREDSAWAVASTADLAKAVAARDQRFQQHRGPARAGRWSARTLHQRIRETCVEARSLAGL